MQFAARSIQSLIESRTLHVLGLARHTEEDTIRDHFMQYGNVLNVRFGESLCALGSTLSDECLPRRSPTWYGVR